MLCMTISQRSFTQCVHNPATVCSARFDVVDLSGQGHPAAALAANPIAARAQRHRRFPFPTPSRQDAKQVPSFGPVGNAPRACRTAAKGFFIVVKKFVFHTGYSQDFFVCLLVVPGTELQRPRFLKRVSEHCLAGFGRRCHSVICWKAKVPSRRETRDRFFLVGFPSRGKRVGESGVSADYTD